MASARTTRWVLLAVASIVVAIAVSAAPPGEVRVRALEAKAVSVALAAFQQSAPKADLERYAIVIGREGRNYHIIFAPDAGPGDENVSAVRQSTALSEDTSSPPERSKS